MGEASMPVQFLRRVPPQQAEPRDYISVVVDDLSVVCRASRPEDGTRWPEAHRAFQATNAAARLSGELGRFVATLRRCA